MVEATPEDLQHHGVENADNISFYRTTTLSDRWPNGTHQVAEDLVLIRQDAQLVIRCTSIRALMAVFGGKYGQMEFYRIWYVSPGGKSSGREEQGRKLPLAA